MNKISTLNVGIEAFSHLTTEQAEHDFPQRFQLLPDGQAIATHLERLYDLRPSDQYLLKLAKPKLTQSDLLRPEKYREQFDQTLDTIKVLAVQQDSKTLTSAAKTLESSQLDQRYLTMALNLLIQV
ncbi:type III secretion system protein VscX [Vibrio tubiashii]|jgi:type III secretion protein X|uniref:Type III secretion protein n=1 Tax=Vibrio tubiashii ATCC 19109 TaxID=1051646 RepID=F9T798_9VIBR|nr:type III secretion system protein VscX [Vibrio tubiashii]AIW14372.1 type III secretion protein [Vibrio tubiashii ATCC 19109]EGU53828.1 Yop protein translocation protein X [Vibrio tubiashii ATCC 19109]EIF03931.1 Yop proteins translocation protein X [Vibrio tubiashii NCIMB 1337 = ATCC 19106]MCG9577590.1 type III secretion system protein VscX [Vibrio tubiashii]MCG9582232.1 type III secretion system protein VscX [Vibrio tubiashii]